MTQTERLAKRAEEVLLNGRWVANTNFKQQLEKLDWQHATQQVASLNTMAALTYHVGGLNQVFKGGVLEIKDKYSFDSRSFGTTHCIGIRLEKPGGSIPCQCRSFCITYKGHG